MGAMVTGRMNHAAVALPDGRSLLVGGRMADSNLPVSSAEIYDPAAGQSTAVGSMGTVRHGPPATLMSDGGVLIAGGDGTFLLPETAEACDP